MDQPSWWGLRGLQSTLALRRGALEDTARLIAEADQLLAMAGERGGAPLVDSPAALCALRRGDAGEARRRADAALERLLATPPMTYPFSDAATGVAQVYAALWSAAPAGDPAAAVLAARMAKTLSVLRNLALMVPMARPRAFLWHGRWAALRGRTRLARWYLRRALEAAERYRLPFDEGLVRQALAEVEEARGEVERAAAHRRRARELFEQLGASWHVVEVAARSTPV